MGIMGELLSMASLLARVLIQVVGGMRSCELNAPLIIRTPMVQKKVSTLAWLPYIFRGCSIACKKLFSGREKMALSKKKKCLRRWVPQGVWVRSTCVFYMCFLAGIVVLLVRGL